MTDEVTQHHYKGFLWSFIRSQKQKQNNSFNFFGRKMWIAFLIICGLIVGTQSAATVTSQLQMEANAILNSGWWNTSEACFNIFDRCTWDDISCNEVGSIKAIKIDWGSKLATPNLSTLNYSGFNNLESLVISGSDLEGTVPNEIGHLSKLTHLDLSYNNLV